MLTDHDHAVEQGAPELAIITALDITEQEQLIKRRMEAVQREQAELVGELSASKKRFSAMIESCRTRMRNCTPDGKERHWVHTVVPIPDDEAKATRVFVYSDRSE